MKFLLFITLCLHTYSAISQKQLSVEDAINMAFQHNHAVQAVSMEIKAQRKMVKSSFDLPKTQLMLMKGQYNSFSKADNNINIVQSVPISIFGSQQAVNRSQLESVKLKEKILKNDLIYNIFTVGIEYFYLHAELKLLLQQDTLFQGLANSSALRFTSGETNKLEQVSAQTQLSELRNKIEKNKVEQWNLQLQLQELLNTPDLLFIEVESSLLALNDNISDNDSSSLNPIVGYAMQNMKIAESQRKLELSKLLPDFLLGYFNQTLIGSINPSNNDVANSSDRFSGFQVGISFHLWPVSQHAKVSASSWGVKMEEQQYFQQQKQVNLLLKQAIAQHSRYNKSISYYLNMALPNAALIIKQAEAEFRNGEISFAEYMLGLQRALSVRENYIITQKEYFQSILRVNYLNGFLLQTYDEN